MTLKLLKSPDKNVVCNLSKEDYSKFRQVLVDNILFTDIKVHFNLLKEFESRLKEAKENPEKGYGKKYIFIKLL